MPFTLTSITEKQKLIIAKGLLDYQFIMNNWKTNSPDFQDVYYDFYLKARWAKMANKANKASYFDLMRTTKSGFLIDIVKALKKEIGSYEFSICSKLLHTKDPSFPIYDSKVRIFLINEMKLDLWHQTNNNSEKSTIDKIEHDWKIICDWYANFLNSQDGKAWITWFDSNFPAYIGISDIKKIDSIIFATN